MSTPIQKSVINIPTLWIEKKSIGKNKVVQFAEVGHQSEVEIFEHSPSSYKLIDELGREICLKLPRSKAASEDFEFVIRAMEISGISQISPETKLKWERHKLQTATKDPMLIVESWSDCFRFKEEDRTNQLKGLRKPQAGAIHAIAAHWSITSKNATVVMPTGTGKTEVMLAVLAMQQCEKLVVIVPSDSLRSQTVNKFIRFGYLQNLRVLPNSIIYPRVAYLKHGMKSDQESIDLAANANVIVTTVSSLNESTAEASAGLAKSTSHLFIDEAHHTSAPTWTKIRDLFNNSAIIQFTATPFRRDGKQVEGDIIYDYPLGLAQENDYFTHINLIKINEIDEHEADRDIARRAIATLDEDLKQFDHIIMARAKSIDRAEALLSIYNELGSHHNPLIVHNELNSAQKKNVFESLKSRSTRIIVCVNMLGEGFDFPNLKIAAIHDIHKNLTTTLQFIGRFTRSSADKIGTATVVVNFADQNVEKGIEELYAENPDWNQILRQQSESTIRKEKRLQEVIKNFSGDLSKQVSIWNLRPSLSAFVYTIDDSQWDPNKFEDVLPKAFSRWPAINQREKLLVFVISREEEVKWGKYRDIHDLSFDLCVVFWDQDSKRLFIHCSDYDAINCDNLAKAICGDSAKIINGMSLFYLFQEMNHPMVRNLGAARTGTISFTMYFGPEVTRGLSEIDKAESTANNIFAWGYENGEMVTYGCSAKSGKVWSHGGGSIVEWKEWCTLVNTKIVDPSTVDPSKIPEIVRGFLRPVSLNGRHLDVAVGIDWGEHLLQTEEHRVYIYFDTTELLLFEVGLEIVDYNDHGPIKFAIFASSFRSEYEIHFLHGDSIGQCVYKHVSGSVVSVRKHSSNKISLDEYMKKDPLIIRYSDASFSYGNYHVATPGPDSLYDIENLETITWSANIHNESQGPERDSTSIQFQVSESLRDEYDIVINDDGSYEAADIICIKKDSEHEYSIHLVHCKYSLSEKPGGAINNLYELCGQAQKCIRWKHNGFDALYEHIKRREAKWRHAGNTRFIKGTLDDLLVFKKFARQAKLALEVSIYQPGLSKSEVSTDIRQLLACTESYLIKTTEARLKVICSV